MLIPTYKAFYFLLELYVLSKFFRFFGFYNVKLNIMYFNLRTYY